MDNGSSMNIMSANHLCKSYGDKVLLADVSFGIAEGDRIGLIGINGTGKSTLLKLIADCEWLDSGSITKGSQVVVHYLPQEPEFDYTATVLDQVFFGVDPGLEHEAKEILTRLGITAFQATIDTLSGGQRKRVALARALIQPADLLILDEPTNHIDHVTVQWLEAYLQKRPGALFMVTHDRYFLERVVNHIFELNQGRLYQHPGNYHAYLENKLVREAQVRASEDKRQNFLRNEIEWIKRGPKARGTKQKARTQRYYDRLDETPPKEEQGLTWSGVTSRLGQTVIELSHVTKGYADLALIRDFSYLVKRQDRIGIVGLNGVGKSTLLKLMAGIQPPDQGTVVIGATVKIGYFSQEYEEMDGNKRVIEFIREVAQYVPTTDGKTISASQMLERFLFPDAVQWTPIAKLSGGEKRRLALLRVLMTAPNVLLLDELTNDLDLPTLSVLESYLEEFMGAVIVVSHDRYFLDRIVEYVFAFEGDGKVSRYLGNFSDYLNRSLVEESASPSRLERPLVVVQPDKRNQSRMITKLTFTEQREYEGIDDRIAELEETLKKVTQQMEHAGGDFEKVQVLYAQQQSLEIQLNDLLERWTYLNERLEEIERNRRIAPETP